MVTLDTKFSWKGGKIGASENRVVGKKKDVGKREEEVEEVVVVILWLLRQSRVSALLLANTAVFPLTRLVESSQPIFTNYNHQIVS